MNYANNKHYQISDSLTINRIVNGMWQVAGGHGYIDKEMAIDDMIKYHDMGFTSWDLADIYGPAEEFIGQFRKKILQRNGKEEVKKIQAFTKWVPNPGLITRNVVKENINKSLNRMNVCSLDLIQFHWWDYNNPYYIDALKYLSELCEEGVIKNIGITNFDTERIQKMVDSDIQIVSNQIQFSIIDRRPEKKMIPFCKNNNVRLLSYGSLCGGLISEQFLGKKNPPSFIELNTLSLKKYIKMIDVWGGWTLFQELLSTLNKIAKKHDVSIANVATKYILDKSMVAGVIIGARLGISEHRNDNLKVFNFNLDKSDYDDIDLVCKKSNDLFETIGDCGDEYR